MATRTAIRNGQATAIAEATNDAEDIVIGELPYIVQFKIEGTSPMLFHRWSVESVAEKAAAAKGSAAKKTDDVESYVWRNEKNRVCVPGEYVRQSMCHAAKFRQDPRSPRKSAFDLYKAAIVALTELAPIVPVARKTATDTWDYLDQRRVTVQRNGITRTRPAFMAGWTAEFQFQVNLPHYVSKADFHSVLTQAGLFIGLGDNRPSYGRFQVVSLEQVRLKI